MHACLSGEQIYSVMAAYARTRGCRTGTSEEDPRDGGVQEHSEPPGVGSPEEVRGGVAAAPAVKDGAPDLGALDVLQRVAIVRRDAGLEEALAQRALPLRHRRAEHQRALHPAV